MTTDTRAWMHDAGDTGTPDAETTDGAEPSRQDASREEGCVGALPSGVVPQGASWAYGGNQGYPAWVSGDSDCARRVTDKESLTAALEGATAGDTVYVDDTVEIDLTGTQLCIPAGVTLASGRGRDGSLGARLFTTNASERNPLRICGDGVRITGLRIEGPETDACPAEWPSACPGDVTGDINCRDCTTTAYAIYAYQVDQLEVDNCEISGWTLAAVRLKDSAGHYVHHNDIHHNQREGLGYGVLLSDARYDVDVVVEWNRFDYNRHAIASSGGPGHDYVAAHNLVHPNANGWVFDVHGQNEQLRDGSVWAGGLVDVHDNVILPTHTLAFVVRGRPSQGAYFWNNCVARGSAESAVAQKYQDGNFFVGESPSGSAANMYGMDEASCRATFGY